LRQLIWLLSLLPVLANAQITYVDHDTDVNGSATSVTAPEYTGAAEDDLVLCHATIDSTDGVWTDPSDFTEIDQYETAASGEVYIGYKIRGSTAGQALTFSYSGTAAAIRATCWGHTGVDTTTPFDVAYSQGSHQNSQTNDSGTTAAQAITTATADAMVVLIQFLQNDGSFTAGAPTNYTLQIDLQVNDRAHQIATRVISSAGLTTPTVWTHTDVASGADTSNVTLALKEAAAATNNDWIRIRRDW